MLSTETLIGPGSVCEIGTENQVHPPFMILSVFKALEAGIRNRGPGDTASTFQKLMAQSGQVSLTPHQTSTSLPFSFALSLSNQSFSVL